MNKFFTISTLVASLLFMGCSKTTAFDFFSTDVYYEKAVSNMQKVSLMSNMETKALLHAVYLNNVDPDVYYDGEYFFVAVHIIEDPVEKSKRGLNNPEYSLTIQEKKVMQEKEFFEAEDASAPKNGQSFNYVQATEVIELHDDHELRLSMPIRNQWNSYYIVKYESSSDSKLILSFESDRYGQALLTFLKAE